MALEFVETEAIELSNSLEEVGVIGLFGWLTAEGEVGEARSPRPGDSFVRFFFRKPNVGIESNGRLLWSSWTID